MLKSLYIKNYAIINELNIDFSKGFNVFTGETGAGKSIIIGALSFLIKGKADTSVIKTGEEKAIIEGVFDIEKYMKPILDEAEIDYDDELIVRRVLSKDNHNSIKINNCSVTLNFLSELLSEHIDIHSQKDSQYLLNKKNHLSLLDRYCNNDEQLKEYKEKYAEYSELLKEFDELSNNTFNQRDFEYLSFDYEELNKANLKIDEENELIEKERRFKDSSKYIESLGNALSLYDADNSIKDKFSSLLKNININDESIINIKNNLENIYYSLNDEMDKLKNIFDSINDEDMNIDNIEERLFTYSKLKRKHNTDVEGLIKLKESIKEKLRLFDDRDSILKEKETQLNKAKNQCILLANKIHDDRVKSALELEKLIVNQCKELMLDNVKFKINISEIELNNSGMDDVEFYISLNKNEELKPLKSVASGGEISRLMLALKTIFAKLSDIILVIFDEIDTGVSGKVGLAVGKKMQTIADDVQIIAITHLASVAACGDHHYYISKTKDSNTQIKELNIDERINELASISSTEISDISIQAAKELFALAHK